jgi:hypothetical protein
MWRTDPERLGESDAFGNVVEVRDFAPLVSYGSLRQLRDEAGGAAYRSWPEDASTTLLRPQIEKAVEEHAEDADDATSRASSYITPSHRYGRRMAEGLVPMGEFGDHYRGNESTLSTTPPPRPGHRGRKLFLGHLLFQFIGGQISKALGKGYKSIDQELNFDVPDMPRPHFFWDHVERQTNYANDLLRDTFCNPDVALTIEQAVGDPPPHATGDDLWDAETVNRPYSLQTPASLRGGDVDRGYTANGPDGSTPTYKDTSTQSWVYVTSSDDPLVSPGFHRLADLRVFPDTACNKIKSQPCGSLTQSSAGSSSQWTSLQWFSTALANGFIRGRRLATAAYSVTYLYVNDAADYTAPETQSFKTGVEALLNARCSTFLAQNGLFGARKCSGQASRWYSASGVAGCDAGRLQLAPTSEYRPIDAYLDRFRSPSYAL